MKIRKLENQEESLEISNAQMPSPQENEFYIKMNKPGTSLRASTSLSDWGR